MYTDSAVLTLSEFAATFKKSRSWAYRMRDEGKLQTIEGYGDLMVPASEVARILEEADFKGAAEEPPSDPR